MAGDLGFEPRHTESESAVLPLHKSPMNDTVIILLKMALVKSIFYYK